MFCEHGGARQFRWWSRPGGRCRSLCCGTENFSELKAAITQTGDVIWSMHKKKNSASVLAGEMILTFYKPI
jgi:hypothetical protein